MTAAKDPKAAQLSAAAKDGRYLGALAAPDPARDLTWRRRGECSRPGRDPELWHAPNTQRLKRRAAVWACGRCPVTAICLRAALDSGDLLTVAGATTPPERRPMLKLWRARHAEPPVRQVVPRRTVAPCGTTAAYRRHVRAGEQACDECLKAVQLDSAERRAVAS